MTKQNEYIKLQKELFLIMSKMSKIKGNIDQANEEQELGLYAEDFPVFEFEVKWTAHFPVEFEPKYIRCDTIEVPI